MQTLIFVFCTKGKSLRDAIENDARLGETPFELTIRRQLKAGRSPGWTEIEPPPGMLGVLKLEWDADASMRKCRVVTRSKSPSELAGKFTTYLPACHGKRVLNISIIPTAKNRRR